MAKEPDYSREIDSQAADDQGDALHQQLNNDQIYEGNDKVKGYMDGLGARDHDHPDDAPEAPEHAIKRNGQAPSKADRAAGADRDVATAAGNVASVGGGPRGITKAGFPPDASQLVDNARDHIGGRAEDRLPKAGNQAMGAQIYGHGTNGTGTSHLLPSQDPGVKALHKRQNSDQRRRSQEDRRQRNLRSRRNRERELEALDREDDQRQMRHKRRLTKQEKLAAAKRAAEAEAAAKAAEQAKMGPQKSSAASATAKSVDETKAVQDQSPKAEARVIPISDARRLTTLKRAEALRNASMDNRQQVDKMTAHLRRVENTWRQMSMRKTPTQQAQYVKEHGKALAKLTKLAPEVAQREPQAVVKALDAKLQTLREGLKTRKADAADQAELANQYGMATNVKSAQKATLLADNADQTYQQMLMKLKNRQRRYFEQSDQLSTDNGKRSSKDLAGRTYNDALINGLDQARQTSKRQYEWLTVHVGHDAANEVPSNLPIQKTNSAIQQADGQHNNRMLPSTIVKGAKFDAKGEREAQDSKQQYSNDVNLDTAAENAEKVAEAFGNPTLTKYLKQNLSMMKTMQQEIKDLHRQLDERAKSHQTSKFKQMRQAFAKNHEQMHHVPTSSMITELAYRGSSAVFSFTKTAFAYSGAALGGALHLGGRVNHHAMKHAHAMMHSVNEGTISSVDSALDPAAAQKMTSQHQQDQQKKAQKEAARQKFGGFGL